MGLLIKYNQPETKVKKEKDYTIHLLILLFLIAALSSCGISRDTQGCKGNRQMLIAGAGHSKFKGGKSY